MPFDKVVACEVERNCYLEIFEFLGERQRQTIQTFHLEARRSIHALHVRRANLIDLGIAHHDVLFDIDDFRRTVPPFRSNGFDGCVGFNN